MDSFFPDLYGIVSLNPSAEILAARWTAVTNLAESNTRAPILALVRVSAGSAGAEPTVVVEAARAADPAFQSVNSEAEVRVLASAAICEILKKPSAVADAAALATSSLALNETRGDDLSKHVQRAAKHYLSEEALRARADDEISTALPAKKRAAALKAYQESAAPHGANVSAAGEPIADLVEQLTQPFVDALGGLQAQLNALREESNMCWWVVTGYSQHLQQRFTEIGVPARSLVAARELAELTELLPGPRSATAFLDHVLAAAGTTKRALSIPEAVNATPREWRKAWLREVSPSMVGDLAPVLLAVQYSLETESDTDWISTFSKSTDIRDVKLKPPALALQAYIEGLLVRAARDLSE